MKDWKFPVGLQLLPLSLYINVNADHRHRNHGEGRKEWTRRRKEKEAICRGGNSSSPHIHFDGYPSESMIPAWKWCHSVVETEVDDWLKGPCTEHLVKWLIFIDTVQVNVVDTTLTILQCGYFWKSYKKDRSRNNYKVTGARARGANSREFLHTYNDVTISDSSVRGRSTNYCGSRRAPSSWGRNLGTSLGR